MSWIFIKYFIKSSCLFMCFYLKRSFSISSLKAYLGYHFLWQISPNSPSFCLSSTVEWHLFHIPMGSLMTCFKNLQGDYEHLGGRCHDLLSVSQTTSTGTDIYWVLIYFYFTNEWINVTFLCKTDALKYTIQLVEELRWQNIEKVSLGCKIQIFKIRNIFLIKSFLSIKSAYFSSFS